MTDTSALASSRPWRQREREWSAFAAAFALACVLFSVWPGLDLALATLFH